MEKISGILLPRSSVDLLTDRDEATNPLSGRHRPPRVGTSDLGNPAPGYTTCKVLFAACTLETKSRHPSSAKLYSQISSSSSFELFVVSSMQDDVYIGHTALALTLGLRVFS